MGYSVNKLRVSSELGNFGINAIRVVERRGISYIYGLLACEVSIVFAHCDVANTRLKIEKKSISICLMAYIFGL